jgi:tetratricopeptide (TPR) repeat protein
MQIVPKFLRGKFAKLFEVFLDNERYFLALSYLKMANRLDPENALVLNRVGSVYAVLGNFITTERYFKKALNIDPSEIMIMQNLGLLYFDNGKYQRAIFYFQKFLKKSLTLPRSF